MIAILIWVALVLFVIVETALVENAAFGWATLMLIICGLAGTGLGVINIVPWILHNPISVLWLFIGYLVVGTGYSVIKWTLYVYNKVAEFKEYGGNATSSIWTRYKPYVSENKERILGWMVFWPFSAAWTLINDPIRKSFNFIYNHISNFLQSISDRAFANLEPQPHVGKQ